MTISTLTRTLALTGLGATIAMGGLSGCNLESVPQALVVRGNKIPEKDCKLNAGGNNRLDGRLDLSLGRAYTAYLEVENRFREISAVTQFEDEDARLESGTVTFTAIELVHRFPTDVLTNAGFQAKLTDLNAPIPGSTVVIPASGFTAPDESAILAADLLPANMGQALRAFTGLVQGIEVEILVEATVIGIRGDGSQVKSATFTYPITVCNNCLVVFDGSPTLNLYGGEDLCALGTDVGVNTVFCGRYAGRDCAEARCLGQLNGAVDLTCPDDGQELSAPVTVP